jgi:hypothetical protein
MSNNYLLINTETNVVDNVVVWDGNTQTWQPPKNYIWFVDEETEALVWALNENRTDFELKPVLGAGGVGFIWDGVMLKTPDSKPEVPVEIISGGVQDL